MVNLAGIKDDDTVLELGAGKGALTSVLSQRAGRVLAVENDPRFVEVLRNKYIDRPNTKIIARDILEIILPHEKFHVVSNIPYAITTPIMKKLLNKPSTGLERGVIMVEKGAAKRFTSKFVKDPYVAAWRMFFDIRYVKEISRNNFSPPPKVDSAIISISRKKTSMVPYKDYFLFWGLAMYMLKEPRQPVETALKGVFTSPQIKRLKRHLGIRQYVPVGSLSDRQWGVIFETMVSHVPKYRWPKMKKSLFG